MSRIDDQTKSKLIKLCCDQLPKAYCPYSHFPVSASILTTDGQFHVGVNVENISFPVGWCAEVSAVAKMITEGNQRRIQAVAVTTERGEFTTPCGRCRQALWEFGDSETPVFLVNHDGRVKNTTLGALLPDAPAIDLAT